MSVPAAGSSLPAPFLAMAGGMPSTMVSPPPPSWSPAAPAPGAEAQQQERPSRTWQFSKTKMCKFEIIGMCAKGEKCPFAHGRAEMKPLPDLTCTKLCKTLIQTGVCESRSCKYAHSKEELRATSAYHKTKLCRFSQNGHCALGDKCNFAHSPDEVRKLDVPAPQQPVPHPTLDAVLAVGGFNSGGAAAAAVAAAAAAVSPPPVFQPPPAHVAFQDSQPAVYLGGQQYLGDMLNLQDHFGCGTQLGYFGDLAFPPQYSAASLIAAAAAAAASDFRGAGAFVGDGQAAVAAPPAQSPQPAVATGVGGATSSKPAVPPRGGKGSTMRQTPHPQRESQQRQAPRGPSSPEQQRAPAASPEQPPSDKQQQQPHSQQPPPQHSSRRRGGRKSKGQQPREAAEHFNVAGGDTIAATATARMRGEPSGAAGAGDSDGHSAVASDVAPQRPGGVADEAQTGAAAIASGKLQNLEWMASVAAASRQGAPLPQIPRHSGFDPPARWKAAGAEDGPAYVTQTASDFVVKNTFLDSGSSGGPLRPIRSAAGRLDLLASDVSEHRLAEFVAGSMRCRSADDYASRGATAAAAAAGASTDGAAGGRAAGGETAAGAPNVGGAVSEEEGRAASAAGAPATKADLMTQPVGAAASLAASADAAGRPQAWDALFYKDTGGLLIDQEDQTWQVKNTFLTFSPQAKPIRSVRTAEGALCTLGSVDADEQ